MDIISNNKSKEFSAENQRVANYCKVFSHPARIAIINLLAEKKEIRTGNISKYLPISRTTVTQHLKVLKSAGIIKGEIDGLKIHYCLNVSKLVEIQSVISTLFTKSISDFKCEC